MHAAVNDPNRYRGPGYRLEGERWEHLRVLPHQIEARSIGVGPATGNGQLLRAVGPAHRGTDDIEVVVAVGPAYGAQLRATIGGLEHGEVLAALLAGIAEGGGTPRLVRVLDQSDVAFIAHAGARLAGSGVAVGLQSKGTTVIHRADLQPLDNLELFGMAPNLSLASYLQIGRNAAGYAVGARVGPVPMQLDNFARAKLIVRTTLMHRVETDAMVDDAPPVDLELV